MSGASATTTTTTATAAATSTTSRGGNKRPAAAGGGDGATATTETAAATVTPSSSLTSLGGGGDDRHGGVVPAGPTDDPSRTSHTRAAAAPSSFGVDGDGDDDGDGGDDVESSSPRMRWRRRTPQQDEGEGGEEEEEDGKPPAATTGETHSDGERGDERHTEERSPRHAGGGVPLPRRRRRREDDEEEEGDGKSRPAGEGETTNGGHRASASAAEAASATSNRRHRENSRKRATRTRVVRIVSATYGPEDGRRLLNGDVVSHSDRTTTLPHRRDVLPVLRALLVAHEERRREARHHTGIENGGVDWGGCGSGAGDCASSDGYDEGGVDGGGGGLGGVAIMDGRSMNVVFGDPCPGTTKRLDVTYVFDPPSAVVVTPGDGDGDGDGRPPARRIRSGVVDRNDDDHGRKDEADGGDVKTQLCRSSFAEHERVVLRRRTTAVPGGRGGRPKNTSAVPAVGGAAGVEGVAAAAAGCRAEPSACWQLCPGTSEIVLPIVLPYLDLRHRVLCSEVCGAWRRVVSDLGVAGRVDVADPSFSKYVDARRFLRGVIKSSYGSLRSLSLNNYSRLERGDFEAAVPHLRRLRSLDVSRCKNLTDETMLLVAEHLGGTLEVLYVKGLRRVGDVGIVAVSEGCTKLRVLEISQVPVSDVGGVAIGTNLRRLEALYMRDNFKLTNRSVDVITSRCDRLEQLTLWGCTRLRGLRFEDDVGVRAGMRNVVLLNLWGCHGLRDDAALGMASLRNLRILIASECHQLSDEFVVNVVRTVPHIQHLHLRYLRRITDAAVDAVASGMPDLRTLDLSFCTAVTAPSLSNLLGLRRRTLTELRLYSCRQLDERDMLLLAGAIIARRDAIINLLDVRGCHVRGDDDDRGRWGPDGVGPEVVRRLTSAAALGFDQPLPGFFVRPAVWNGDVRGRLVGQVAGRFGVV